jgi:hypothetical protein
VILLVLIALVARVNAAPEDDSIALAGRYADILTGVDRDHDGDNDDGDNDDGDDEGDNDEGELDTGAGAEKANAHAHGDADAETFGDDAERAELASHASDAEAAGFDAGDAEAASLNAGDLEAASFDAGDLEASEQFADGGDDGDGGSSNGGDDGDPAGGDPGQLAMLDVEQAPVDVVTGADASFAAVSAGAEETYEAWMRHRRPSRWGRLDVGVAWRRGWREPMHLPAYRSDEVWLLATWRR